jgi:hypothetical protein
MVVFRLVKLGGMRILKRFEEVIENAELGVGGLIWDVYVCARGRDEQNALIFDAHHLAKGGRRNELDAIPSSALHDDDILEQRVQQRHAGSCQQNRLRRRATAARGRR